MSLTRYLISEPFKIVLVLKLLILIVLVLFMKDDSLGTEDSLQCVVITINSY